MSRSHTEISSRIAAVAALILLGACAQGTSTAATPTASTQTETVVDAPSGGQPGSGTLRYRTEVDSHTATLDVPVDSAWARVQRVYTALKIPVTTVDPTRHLIGAERAIVHDHVAGARMSRWISCGLTSMGQPRADSYTVYLTVLTDVVPAGTGSAARTVVNASAQPTDGSTNRVQCSSTGALEAQLAESFGAQD